MSRLSRLLRKRQRGSIYVFWAISMPVLILILAAVIEFGRYWFLRNQIQISADAAALAAASQIDIPAFENGQGVMFNGYAFSQAQAYMLMNCNQLISKGGSCILTRVEFDEDSNSVAATVSSDLSLFFPRFIPAVRVTLVGYSQVAPFIH